MNIRYNKHIFMESTKRIECIISGRVQMVMYRDYVARCARFLGIAGTVSNNLDGTVTVIAESEERKLDELIAHLRKGSFLSMVEDVEVAWMSPTQEFLDFRILYTK